MDGDEESRVSIAVSGHSSDDAFKSLGTGNGFYLFGEMNRNGLFYVNKPVGAVRGSNGFFFPSNIALIILFFFTINI